MTTWTSFGPDPPIATLPDRFRTCLPPNQPSSECDLIVGNTAMGEQGTDPASLNGFCADPQYRETTYCACVNNAIPCPMIAAAACANSAFSYLPTGMIPPSGEHYLTCKNEPICINILEVGGSQNVVSGITQQCGIITNITNVVKANPSLAIIIFVLLIALIVVTTIKTDGKSIPPAPPQYLFVN